MKGPEGYGEIINIVMNIVLGLIITLAINIVMSMQLGVNVVTVEGVVATWFSSFVVGYTAGCLGDPIGWAMKLGQKLGVRGSALQYCLNALVLALYMGTLIDFGNMLITMLPNGLAAWADMFITWLVFIWVAAFVSILIFLKPVQIAASKISGFDPRVAAPEA